MPPGAFFGAGHMQFHSSLSAGHCSLSLTQCNSRHWEQLHQVGQSTQQTCNRMGGVGYKGIVWGDDMLAQHRHLQVLVPQARLAQTRHCPGVPLRTPHRLDCAPHVLPRRAAAIPINACHVKHNVEKWNGLRDGCMREFLYT